MEVLCESAISPDSFPNMAQAPSSGAHPDGKLKGNESVNERVAEQQSGQQHHRKSSVELLNDAIEAETRATTLQKALIESLSRGLPNLLPSKEPTAQLEQPTDPANESQPSIYRICDRRLNAREDFVSMDVTTDQKQTKYSMGITIHEDIEISTKNRALPSDLGDKHDGVV